MVTRLEPVRAMGKDRIVHVWYEDTKKNAGDFDLCIHTTVSARVRDSHIIH